MLVIRFFRVGKINQPCFKIVVTDKRRSSTTGRFVEEVGFYNPITKEKVLRADRIKHWISVGAQPSPTVFNLFLKEKIVEGKKIDVHKKAKKKEVKPGESVATPVLAAAAVPTPVASAAKPAEEAKPAVSATPAEKPAEASAPVSPSKPIEEVRPAQTEKDKPASVSSPAPVPETVPNKEEKKTEEKPQTSSPA